MTRHIVNKSARDSRECLALTTPKPILPMPFKVLPIRSKCTFFLKHQRLPGRFPQPETMRGPLGEGPVRGHNDLSVFVHGPQSGIEHPMRIGGQGEAIPRIVVLAFCPLMDMGGFDKVSAIGRESVPRQRAGEAVSRQDLHLETQTSPFPPVGKIPVGILPKRLDVNFPGWGKIHGRCQANTLFRSKIPPRQPDPSGLHPEFRLLLH